MLDIQGALNAPLVVCLSTGHRSVNERRNAWRDAVFKSASQWLYFTFGLQKRSDFTW